jgi:hypothetical protein
MEQGLWLWTFAESGSKIDGKAGAGPSEGPDLFRLWVIGRRNDSNVTSKFG